MKAIYILFVFTTLLFSGTANASGFFIGGGVSTAGHSENHSTRAAYEAGYDGGNYSIGYKFIDYNDRDYQTVSLLGNVHKNLRLGVGVMRSGHEDFAEKENSLGLVAEIPIQLNKRASIVFNAGVFDTEREDPYGVVSSNTTTTRTHQHVNNSYEHVITEETIETASAEERNDYTAVAGITLRLTF